MVFHCDFNLHFPEKCKSKQIISNAINILKFAVFVNSNVLMILFIIFSVGKVFSQ